MVSDLKHTHIDLDLRELRCPHLLIATIKAVEKLDADQVIRIAAADLNAPSSIGSWTRQSGNELLDMYQEDEAFYFLIKRQPAYSPITPEAER